MATSDSYLKWAIAYEPPNQKIFLGPLNFDLVKCLGLKDRTPGVGEHHSCPAAAQLGKHLLYSPGSFKWWLILNPEFQGPPADRFWMSFQVCMHLFSLKFSWSKANPSIASAISGTTNISWTIDTSAYIIFFSWGPFLYEEEVQDCRLRLHWDHSVQSLFSLFFTQVLGKPHTRKMHVQTAFCQIAFRPPPLKQTDALWQVFFAENKQIL